MIIEHNRQTKKNNIHYMEIYRRVKDKFGQSNSDNKLSSNKLLRWLSIMIDEKLLIKINPTGRRGSKVFFELTEKAKEKYRLKILGAEEEIRKRKNLYQLLIFFELYKRRPLLTKIQLSKFLKQIGSSMNKLQKVRESHLFSKFPAVFFKPIKGVDIMGLIQRDAKTKSNKILYYTVIPGFSLEEFVLYLKLLKNGMEPRPFTTSRTLIPFVLYTSFTKKDIVEAIDLFQEDGLFKRIDPIVPGEKRFNIANDDLKYLSYAIWRVRIFDYELMVRRLIHKSPTDRDREYLSLYFGKRGADIMLAIAHDNIRGYFKKEKHEQDEEKEAIQKLEQNREFLIQETEKKYGNTFKENEVVRGIMEEICYSPFFKKES